MITGADELREAFEGLLANIERSTEDGELIEVDDAIIVVHVNYGAVDDEGSEGGSTFYRSTSAKPHVQLGLIERGRSAILASSRPVE